MKILFRKRVFLKEENQYFIFDFCAATAPHLRALPACPALLLRRFCDTLPACPGSSLQFFEILTILQHITTSIVIFIVSISNKRNLRVLGI